jgi:hypothetical protein
MRGARHPVNHCLLCVILCFVTTMIAAAEQTYPDSVTGLQAQIVDTIRAAGSSDQAAAKSALESLAIPSADKWFAAHFESRFSAQLPTDYSTSLAKFQSHVAWIAMNFSKFDDFGLKAEGLDNPPALRDTGFESLLPHPSDTIKIENYRLTSTTSDPNHGPPSWVSGFVYIEGSFRWVGGTYPFWDEGLTALRGPMSMPPSVIHGRTVQGIAFRKDQKVPGLDAVVQLKIRVGRDGRVDHVKALSGEEPFVRDAKDYVKSADFGALPKIPQLANATREWEFEVAFFTPK